MYDVTSYAWESITGLHLRHTPRPPMTLNLTPIITWVVFHWYLSLRGTNRWYSQYEQTGNVAPTIMLIAHLPLNESLCNLHKCTGEILSSLLVPVSTCSDRYSLSGGRKTGQRTVEILLLEKMCTFSKVCCSVCVVSVTNWHITHSFLNRFAPNLAQMLLLLLVRSRDILVEVSWRSRSLGSNMTYFVCYMFVDVSYSPHLWSDYNGTMHAYWWAPKKDFHFRFF